MNAARKTMQKTSPRVYTVYTAQTIQSCDIHVFGESSGIHMLWEMFAYSHTWLQRSPNHVNRASFPHVANIQGPWHHYCSIYVFIVAHLKRWLSLTLNHLDCSFQQNFTARRKLEDSKSVIQPFGHVSGKIWTSMFRVRPFPPFSRPFPPFSVLWISVFSCFSWFTFVFPHENNFCRIHFRCLLEICCKCQKATNNSSETAFCGQWQSRWQILATQQLRPQF